ncbi:CapA family protein [Cohnella sp. CFH 77786]|uniref:CapA family protein n=1 Tax=Cohnella sp. CFH 77786 TaxID=2662265 RepID=UPI001C6090BD|nr:CapA family protein [Cohnella sp. CFH 77786]MBW5445298.1 CapA family protein [Cohnella sp. CFH 77786]
MDQEISFIASGDSFITRRLPSFQTSSFQRIAKLFHNADVRFTNLETTLHHYDCVPSALSGGTWAVSPPEVLEDLKAYGINAISWANNHTMDYLYEGLAATESHLNRYGFIHAGAGRNLAEASEVRYLETPSGRVGLIAATSTFHEFQMAGEQRSDMIGRPGIHPLRYISTYGVPEDKLETLKEIARSVHLNAKRNKSIQNGYLKDEEIGVFAFGTYRFKADETAGVSTSPHETDMKRIRRRIAEAKRQADYVLVSIHTHEMNGDRMEEPAEFIRTFARACIDEGAHAVIGHGPHVLRGIEIYRKRPIFYSLGNFIFHNETLPRLPAESYDKYGLGPEHTVADVFDCRSANGTRGYAANPQIWRSVLPYWKMRNGELTELTLFPIELGFGLPRPQRGWPELSSDREILLALRELSSPFGTQIEIDGIAGRVVL